MKKLYLIFIFFILIPWITMAQSSISRTNNWAVFVSWNDTYEIWKVIEIWADVKGDFYWAGSIVNVNKNVWQGLTVAWWTVTVSGNIWDDARIAGWNIIIQGNISWDLIVAWWQVQVMRWTKIWWNLILNWWNLLFDWAVSWDSYINWWNLNLGWTIWWNANFNIASVIVDSWAKISWNLAYSSNKTIPDLEKITSWKKQFTMQSRNKNSWNRNLWNGFWEIILWLLLYRFLFLVVFWSLLYFFFEKLFIDAWKNLENMPGKSFLYWLLYFLLMPFVILFLFLIIIWIPFALLFLILYIFSFVLYKLITVLVFSSFFINKYLDDKMSFWKKFWIIVLTALVITPWSLIDFIAALFAFWALFQKKLEIINNTRK